MKLGIILYSNDPEKLWNGFRVGNTSLAYSDDVSIFLLGQGVECNISSTLEFDVNEQLIEFVEMGGTLLGCKTCCEKRSESMPFLTDNPDFKMASMSDLYNLIATNDKVVSF